ncbi:outer membrane protein slp precursor [bacterium BMS3Abin07]|nr:outer membrane protein slp precursor [bacterium BMS3Abin07]
MKKLLLIILISITLISCVPVIRKELLNSASREIPFSGLRINPDLYAGKLFVLGGIVVKTKVTADGSRIEAIYVPVDSNGYLQDIELPGNRFMAIYPKQQGLLDPLIYRKGRKITIAGEFTGTQTGKIGEMEYKFPVFEIKDIYLWNEKQYYIAPPYPVLYPAYPYWWDDPWWYRHYYQPRYYWYGPPRRR